MNQTKVFLEEWNTVYFFTLDNFFNDDMEKTEIVIQMLWRHVENNEKKKVDNVNNLNHLLASS